MNDKRYSGTATKTEAMIEADIRSCVTGESAVKMKRDSRGRHICPVLEPSDLEKTAADCGRVYVAENSQGVLTCYCGPHKHLKDSNGQYR